MSVFNTVFFCWRICLELVNITIIAIKYKILFRGIVLWNDKWRWVDGTRYMGCLFRQSSFPSVDKCQVIHKAWRMCSVCYIPEIAFWVSKIGSRTGMGPLWKTKLQWLLQGLGTEQVWTCHFSVKTPQKYWRLQIAHCRLEEVSFYLCKMRILSSLLS